MNVEGRVGDEDFPRDAAAQVFRPQQDGIGLEMSAHWMKASILREFVQSKWVHLLRFQRMFEKSWQIKTHGTRTRVPQLFGSWNGETRGVSQQILEKARRDMSNIFCLGDRSKIILRPMESPHGR